MDNPSCHVPELDYVDNEVSLHVRETFAENLIKYKLNPQRTECFATMIRVLSTRQHNPYPQKRCTANDSVKYDQMCTGTFLMRPQNDPEAPLPWSQHQEFLSDS